MRAKRVSVLIALICFISVALVAGDKPPSGTMPKRNMMCAADQAFALALKYTGFSKLAGFSTAGQPQPELVTITDDQTPFLHVLINDRSIWHILFKQVPIAHPNNKDAMYYRDFSILLDSESGRLLRIYARKNESDSGILPLPPPAVAEQQMKNAGAEEYLGLPENIPKITFIEAIRNVFGNPETALEIIAVYVIDKRMNHEPCPVWAIDLRGIPPVPTINPGGDEKVPVRQRNHFRTVIDAETGHQLFFNNVPQPESPPDK
jgi:hypothetical protein